LRLINIIMAFLGNGSPEATRRRGPALLLNHPNPHFRLDRGVEADRYFEDTDRPERLVQLDRPLVNRMARFPQLGGDVPGGDGSEEPIAFPRLDHERERD